MNIYIRILNKQEKISNFLSSIDFKIDKFKKELDTL